MATKDEKQPTSPHIEGEGSYEAAREYDRNVEAFARSGQVDAAAQEARESLERDPEALREAEERGKQPAREMVPDAAEPAPGEEYPEDLVILEPDARLKAMERVNELVEQGYSESQALRIAARESMRAQQPPEHTQ